MKKNIFTIAISAIIASMSMPSHAQIPQAVDAINRGRDILDFYKAAISNPAEVLTLQLEIQSRFAGRGSRYEGLNNDLAQKFGIFNYGPLSLDHIEILSEPSSGSEYGYFSITLKQLPLKECEILSNYPPFFQGFVRIELNGEVISQNGMRQQVIGVCKGSLPLTHAKNEIKFVSY